MSEQEKNTGSGVAGGSVVMVEQTTTDSHQKIPYRPNELQEDTDIHHKRSTAPAVPSVAEQLKDVPEDSTENDIVERKEQKECEPTMSSEKQKYSIAKKISSSAKRRERSPESIAMTPIDSDKKKGIVAPSQPIPAEVQPAVSATLDVVAAEKDAAKKADDDSITEEITEMRIPEVAKEHSEWSDDEEAGGLPRSDSRGSRVSRAVRQFFCCGVSYEAPSEENISTHRRPYSHGI